MRPTAYIYLDALPLSANGKVDRKALPAPEAASVDNTLEAPPQTEIERVIAEIVADVLQVPAAGTDRNFFDLGANSIHLVQIHRRVRAAIGIDFPLIDVFQHPTIRLLAARAGQGTAEQPQFDDMIERASKSREQRRKRQARATREGNSQS
jgi:acyl carrier protein